MERLETMAHFAAWYVAEDYDNIRKIMDDVEKLPPTFAQWEKTIRSQIAEAAKLGLTINPIILNSQEFVAFCQENREGAKNADCSPWNARLRKTPAGHNPAPDIQSAD
jgi:hypothetical protein